MKEDKLRSILSNLDKEHPLNYEFFIILNSYKVKYTLRDKVRMKVKRMLPEKAVKRLRQNRFFKIILKIF